MQSAPFFACFVIGRAGEPSMWKVPIFPYKVTPTSSPPALRFRKITGLTQEENREG